MEDVPKALRSKVLAQKIRQISPFHETSQFVIQENDSAMVWFWDEANRRVAIEGMEEKFPGFAGHFSSLSVIPETVLRSRVSDGRLGIRQVSGVELQLWRDSVLMESEWRASDATALAAATLEKPWGGTRTAGSLSNEALWLRGAALLLFLVLVSQFGALVAWSTKVALKENETRSGRVETSEFLSLRSEVRRIRSDNEMLLGWLSQPSQIATLADFDELLQETAEISRWEYQDGELVATINDKRLNNRRFIESLSSGSHFDNVRVDPGARLGTVIISLEVAP